MQITEQDRRPRDRNPTVSRNTSLGREYYRAATWEGEDCTVKVTAIAFVTGIRARRNADGSVDLQEQVTRFDVLRQDEFLQPVERAVFLWDRERIAEDGTTVYDQDIDYSNEIGKHYVSTVAEAEERCWMFLDSLSFAKHFDPSAWA